MNFIINEVFNLLIEVHVLSVNKSQLVILTPVN